MTEPVLHLHSASLLSKWGFNDGGCPDAYLDWCDATGADYPAHWGVVLIALVRRYLLPALEQEVEVTAMSQFGHNPIRASTVDGKDVSHLHYVSKDPAYALLTPASVSVPYSEVQRVITELQKSPEGSS